MIRPEVLSLPAYHFKAREHTVKLDQNESAYDFDADMRQAVADKLHSELFNRYPDMHAERLRDKLADINGWPAKQLVISGGSNILIQALVIIAGINRTVLTVSPSFSVYALQAQLLGATLNEIPLNTDFSLPLADLKTALRNGEGVFFLANPAATTGNSFSREDILELIAAAGERWLVVIDEAYQDFSGTDFSDLALGAPSVVCLRTFSKALGAAGVRIGYALASAHVAEQLQKALLPFSVSSVQLAVGEVVLEQRALHKARVDEVLRERARVFNALNANPFIDVFPSDTNFLLFRVQDAESFYNGLLEKGVLIRRQDHLPGLTGCLRVSIGRPEENEAFLSAVTDLTATPQVAHD